MRKPARQAADDSAQVGGPGKRQRQLRRLERQLAKTTEVEAKRAHQLDAARERRTALETALAALRSPTPDGQPEIGRPGSVETASDEGHGPRGFCLRERRMVLMLHPTPFRMKNGRAAVTGRCSSCGVRVTTTARGAIMDAAAAAPAAR